MKLRRMLLGAVAALALTLGFASPALAAETTSSGSVQNLANQAVSNAAVDLYYWDDGVEDWQWTDSTTTNASGGYSFTVDDQLSYAVSVYKNGYVDSDREVR
ncbi:MAG: carboxypeptidase regulatory-like domain-containing protein, partial [Actinobacteria bacterium]|nr:carboxypeptidase regulatory-like domain-containing protein [Actinomycetota bacterium]